MCFRAGSFFFAGVGVGREYVYVRHAVRGGEGVGGAVRTGVFDVTCVFNQRHIVTLKEASPFFCLRTISFENRHRLFILLMLLHGFFFFSLFAALSALISCCFSFSCKQSTQNNS